MSDQVNHCKSCALHSQCIKESKDDFSPVQSQPACFAEKKPALPASQTRYLYGDAGFCR